jgi:hypothetical protein
MNRRRRSGVNGGAAWRPASLNFPRISASPTRSNTSRYLLHAAKSQWLDPWLQEDEDPEMEWKSIWWQR